MNHKLLFDTSGHQFFKWLETNDDIQWLFDTALKTINRPSWVKLAILYGNEDCPDKVALFDDPNPNFDTKPTFTIVWQ